MQRAILSLYVLLGLALALSSLGIAFVAVFGLIDRLDTASRVTMIIVGSAIVMGSAFAVSEGSFGRRSSLKRVHAPGLFWFTAAVVGIFGASIGIAGLFPIQGLTL